MIVISVWYILCFEDFKYLSLVYHFKKSFAHLYPYAASAFITAFLMALLITYADNAPTVSKSAATLPDAITNMLSPSAEE